MEDSQIPQVNLKRKRSSPSLSSAAPPPPQKAVKTSSSSLQINYLARRSPQDLPLIDKTERLPNIIDVLSAYTSVLDRHESLASNMGARPLGPILIKRFERCFDAPPQIVTSHSHAKDTSDAPQVTWLEVIQFAQSHPGQFTLSNQVEGRPVCQFYFPQKQSRVQVSEEDYLFIKSGRCQDLIPSLPIREDEEKEVGTCEIMEKSLRELIHAADTVSARARQLAHRLKSRRMAIMERRAEEENGGGGGNNAEKTGPLNDNHAAVVTTSGSYANGQSNAGPTADATVRNDLLRHFQAKSQSQATGESFRRMSTTQTATSPTSQSMHREISPPHPQPGQATMQPQNDRPDVLSYYLSDTTTPLPPVSVAPPPHRESKHNFARPLKPDAELTQPYRAFCQAHMESLGRGARVIPPCDRCRRLKMDCLKNLTSCQGCTKKHARCHWRDVERSEVEGLEGAVHERLEHDSGVEHGGGRFAQMYGSEHDDEDDLGEESEDEGMGALQDLEALERQSEEDVSSGESLDGSRMDVDHPGPAALPSADVRPSSKGTTQTESEGSAQVVAVSGAHSVAEISDKARSVYGDELPYAPAPSADSTAANSTPRPEPATGAPTPQPSKAAAMAPPPPRPRQGSYGFPPPGKEQQQQQQAPHNNSTPPLDTASSKPEKYIHVSTPHPGHKSSSGFTSVNASAFNTVNGDSNVTSDEEKTTGVSSTSITSARPALPPVPSAWARSNGAEQTGSAKQERFELHMDSAGKERNGTLHHHGGHESVLNGVVGAARDAAVADGAIGAGAVIAAPPAAGQSVAVGPAGGATQGWRGA